MDDICLEPRRMQDGSYTACYDCVHLIILYFNSLPFVARTGGVELGQL